MCVCGAGLHVHWLLPATAPAAACSIQLSKDLNLSSTVYGLGSGAFFLAYACGQIPSNFLLLKYGGPTWLAAITVVWGLAASVSTSSFVCCMYICVREIFVMYTHYTFCLL